MASRFPSPDAPFTLLRRAGWFIGETATAGGWPVTATNGDVDQPYYLLCQRCLGLLLGDVLL